MMRRPARPSYLMSILPELRDDLKNGTLTGPMADLLYLIAAFLDAGMTDTNIYLTIGHTKDGGKHLITPKGVPAPPMITGTDWEELGASIRNAVDSLLEPL